MIFNNCFKKRLDNSPSYSIKMALLLIFCASWQAQASVDGDKQTIGELLDRNAQNPDRLILSAAPKQEISNIEQTIDDARLAAIEHYERVISINAAPAIKAEAMRRAADLRVEFVDAQLAESDDVVSKENELKRELQSASQLYSRLLREYSDYRAADLVLYQLARAYDLSGQDDRAIDSLRRLALEYPQSKRLRESSFRAAEMLYLRKRYGEAVEEYRRITEGDSATEYWWLAQYKLAWTYYQLDEYSDSVTTFSKILDELNIDTEISSLDEMLVFAPQNKAELVRDAVRGMSKAFSKYAAIKGINNYFAHAEDSEQYQYYYPVIYRALADIFTDEKRYTDAASVYEAFASLHPAHVLAQSFSELAIDSYLDGGFKDLAVAGQEQYLLSYGPETPVWQDETTPDSHRLRIRSYMNDIATFRHAQAQQLAGDGTGGAKQRFSKVADRYLAIITAFPEDQEIQSLLGHYADSLCEAERFNEAALQYGKLAYQYKDSLSAGDSALAQVKSYRQWYESLKRERAPEQNISEAHAQVFEAISLLASRFSDHPQRSFVLLAAAEDYYELKRFDAVIEICLPLFDDGKWTDEELHTKALGLLADSYFLSNDFSNSETFYTALVPRLGDEDRELKTVAQSRLAISVYRQAELARTEGKARLAAVLFQRSASLSADRSLVSEATYNAAGQLFEVSDWAQSAQVLERFTTEFIEHSMIIDADKMLATAYQKSARPGRAAKVYERLAGRTAASADLRRTAQLTAGNLYISAGLRRDGERVLKAYLLNYPLPLEDAQKTRLLLAELYPINSESQFIWLRALIVADEVAGGDNESSQLMAADASFKLAMADVRTANSISLSLPIDKSLPRRRAAMEKAIGSLAKSASFGFSDTTTSANYELGELYRHFASALLESEVPKKLDGDVLEQYMILLEEQAYPFEEKAIAEYESNMALVKQGVWTSGVRNSLMALAKLAPAKYGKQPQLEKVYDSLF